VFPAQQPVRDLGFGNGPGVRPQMGGGKGQPQPMQSQSYMPPPQMGGGKGQPVGLGQAGLSPQQYANLGQQLTGGFGQPQQITPEMMALANQNKIAYMNQPQPGLQPANPANVFPAQQPVRDLGFGNGPGVGLGQYVNTISGQPNPMMGDPIRPLQGVGQPVNLGQLSQPVRQPNPMMVDPIRPKPFMAQPVKKEDPRQVQQRAMQQLANAKRLGR
jgi:hypothetical protein